MTPSSSLTNYRMKTLPQDTRQNSTFIFFSRLVRFAFLFAYATLPIWVFQFVYSTNYYDISSTDMLLAMAWMPISGAIIALSFMKFGWRHKLKGLLLFITYNITITGFMILIRHFF